MKVLWFTWKDRRHPAAGGAELVNEEIAKRLVAAGHEVRFVVAGFPGGAAEESRDGFRILRVGGRWSVYWRAWLEYRRHQRGWADVAVDEINTMPFFCSWYVREPVVLFVHQLCREIWFHELPWPVGAVGYVAEPAYLRLLSGLPTATVSESSKRDLLRHGFHAGRVTVLPQGIATEPVGDLAAAPKAVHPTMLYLGAFRSMKRVLHVLRAYEIARRELPDLRLTLAGDASGSYGRKVLRALAASPAKDGIRYAGKVDAAAKIALLRESHLLCATSVKEGWGLVVSEAGAQGTPSVVYDVDGLRDSVRDGETGVVTGANAPEDLAREVVSLLRDPERYERLRLASWRQASAMSFDASAAAFGRVLENAAKTK